MGFKAHLIEKVQAFVKVHYKLHNNEADYLKNPRLIRVFSTPTLI